MDAADPKYLKLELDVAHYLQAAAIRRRRCASTSGGYCSCFEKIRSHRQVRMSVPICRSWGRVVWDFKGLLAPEETTSAAGGLWTGWLTAMVAADHR